MSQYDTEDDQCLSGTTPPPYERPTPPFRGSCHLCSPCRWCARLPPRSAIACLRLPRGFWCEFPHHVKWGIIHFFATQCSSECTLHSVDHTGGNRKCQRSGGGTSFPTTEKGKDVESVGFEGVPKSESSYRFLGLCHCRGEIHFTI